MPARKKSAAAVAAGPVPSGREPPALYLRHYRCIYADPPWKFLTRAPNKNPKSDRSVERHYQTMTFDEICGLPVQDLAHPDGCHLFMWVTGPYLEKAFAVAKAWGFRYSASGFIWLKLKRKHGKGHQIEFVSLAEIEHEMHVGLGFTTRKNVEFCLLFRRGSPKRLSKKVREVVISAVREHSRKPDSVPHRIEEYCAGPYLELFSRSDRPGWTVWGDQLGKYEAEE